MKLSAAVFLTDVLPHKRKLFNKIVKNKLFENLTTQQVFSKFKKAGITGVEVLLPSSATVKDIKEVKKILDDNGMKVYSLHQALRFITKTKLPEITELFTFAKILETDVIVLHMNSAGKQILDSKYLSAIRLLQVKNNIKVGFENREKHIGSKHRSYGWDENKFSDLMKKEDLFITLDICHLGQADGDIVDFYNKNSDRVINIHLSDYKSHYLNNSLRPLRYKHLPLGKGELPIEEFIKALKRKKYNGVLTLEINTDLNGLLQSAAIVTTTS